MITSVLHKIASQLNRENITWALGGSMILYRKGIVDRVNDIDLLVMEKDIEKVNQILSTLGTKKQSNPSKQFLTTYFYEYSIDEIEVDVMCQLKIAFEDSIYTYIFDEKSIVEVDHLAREKTYFTSIEDWYVLYHLMRVAPEKIIEIEKHFMIHHVEHLQLLQRTLTNVPERLKRVIQFQLHL